MTFVPDYNFSSFFFQYFFSNDLKNITLNVIRLNTRKHHQIKNGGKEERRKIFPLQNFEKRLFLEIFSFT